MQLSEFVGKRVRLECALRTKQGIVVEIGRIMRCTGHDKYTIWLWDEERGKMILGIPPRCVSLVADQE